MGNSVKRCGLSSIRERNPGAAGVRVFTLLVLMLGGSHGLSAIDRLEGYAAPGNSVFLRWVDSDDGETGFRIERKSGMDGFEDVVLTPANVVNYTDTALSPGTEYTYRVSPVIPGTTTPGMTVSVSIPRTWEPSRPVVTIAVHPDGQGAFSLQGEDAVYTVDHSADLVSWVTIHEKSFVNRMETIRHTFDANSQAGYYRIQVEGYEHPLQIGLDRPFEMPPEPSGAVWDVTTFGASPAKFDPDNDDAVFIRLVLSLAEPGDVVLIPAGTYTIRQVLTIPDGITLRGAGMDETVLVTEGIDRAISIPQEAHDIRVEDLAINYLGETEELQFGIYVGSARQGRNSYRILIDSIRVEGFSVHAVSLRDCHHVLVQNCHLLNATNLGGGGHGYGVALNYPTNHNNWIRNNTIGPVIRHAVLLQYFAHNNLVEYNLATDNSEDMYDLHGEDEYLNELRFNIARNGERDGFGVGNTGSTHDRAGPNNWIHHNTVENCLSGVEVIQGSDLVFIDNNTFTGNEYGIRVYNGSGDHLYIRGNRIVGNDRGISLLDTRWVWIEDNIISDQARYGIEILTGVEDLVDQDNIFSGNARDYGP